MPVGPLRPRDLPVGDVAHEEVAERVLDFLGDRAGALAPDELLPLEGVQEPLEVGP
jgi:hypothetical protein